MKVLVTGASGFIGRALCAGLLRSSQTVRGTIRQIESRLSTVEGIEFVVTGTIGASTNWSDALRGVDVVIHLIARVHMMTDTSGDSLTKFRRVNVDSTLNLARQAAAADVRRFIFISSIKVNGESTRLGQAFTANDVPDPRDPYSMSKHEAEQGLLNLAAETGMEVVVIRPPLVYGPEVKANFQNMMCWLKRGVPLPLGAIHNKRSLVALDNLVDLIVTCVDHPAAANQTFMVSDGENLSTTDLLRRMGQALGRPTRLVPVPILVLYAGAAMIGKRAVARRLCGSLQVDIGKTRELLGWVPPVSVDEALRETARAFLKSL